MHNLHLVSQNVNFYNILVRSYNMLLYVMEIEETLLLYT